MKKDECNCCVGTQSTSWESWEVEINDFYNDCVDIYREINFNNYCYKCGKKIDKEKYKKLIEKIIKKDEENK